jgi:hypothetical protein
LDMRYLKFPNGVVDSSIISAQAYHESRRLTQTMVYDKMAITWCKICEQRCRQQQQRGEHVTGKRSGAP